MIPSNLEQSGAADSCAATIGDPEDNLDDVTDEGRGSNSHISPLSPLEDKDSCCTTSQDYVDCPIEQDPVCDKSITVTAMTELSGPGESGRTGVPNTRDCIIPQRTRKVNFKIKKSARFIAAVCRFGCVSLRLIFPKYSLLGLRFISVLPEF